MNYKFKNTVPTQTRKSVNNPHNSASYASKNQLLTYISLLDKCIQILREDRLWIRNQLKADDMEVIGIFKQARRPLNLQHLQIRLRKHITAAKSKAKMEQLMRFKENMNISDSNKSKEQFGLCEEFTKPLKNTSNNMMNRTLQNNQNSSSLKSGHSQRKSYRDRMNSLEKPKEPVSYPNRNNSSAHRKSHKTMQSYPVPMEQVTEHESQNITTTRNRIQLEQCTEDSGFGINPTYNAWKQPEHYISPLGDLKKNIKQKYKGYGKTMGPHYDFEPQTQFTKINPQQYSASKDIKTNYPQNQFSTYEKKQQNEYKKYKIPTPSTQIHEINKPQHQEYKEDHFQTYSRQNKDYLHTPISSNYNHPSSEVNQISNDGIFTSSQFLQECRNFIKNKSSAKKSNFGKEDNNSMLERNSFNNQQHSYPPLNFDQRPPLQIEHSSPYIQNNIRKEQSQKKYGSSFNESAKFSDHANTVEAYNPLPETLQKNIYQKISLQNCAQGSNNNNRNKIPMKQLNTPEKFVDQILNSVNNQDEGYIKWKSLIKLVNNLCPEFLDTFAEYLQPQNDDQYVLISNAGRVMEDLLQNEHETENQVNNIYRLLDIEHKGYITQNDIKDFIEQLQDAEAQEVSVISQLIYQLFESIDQDSEESDQKRIDYWGIYSRKHAKQFIELSQILKQFEFQIE